MAEPIYHFDIIQGTPEWHAIRKGKMTGSNAQAIGNNGKGLTTYIKKVCGAFFSSAIPVSYTNEDIERGHELEGQARTLYSLETGNEVTEVGFITYNDFIGTSPDGLVGEDGLIEVKSLNDDNHFALILDGKEGVDSAHRWQIQFNLWVSGRKWCDYISYNPNYEKALEIHRFERDTGLIAQIQEGCASGLELMKAMKAKYQAKLGK